MRARRLRVHGQVQGVWFRAATRERAEQDDVAGWAYNASDGAVVVWLEGEPPAVDAVEGWIRAGGPPAATVERVEAADVAAAGHTSFEVRSGPPPGDADPAGP